MKKVMLNRTCLPTWKLVAMRASSYPVRQERVICVLYRVEHSPAGQAWEEAPESMQDACPDESLPLYDMPPLYAIGIETPDDQQLCLVGRDFERVSQLYSLVVRMEVTPCTLGDVVTDLST